MNKKFANPYILFYPVLSRDGMPFPINKCIRDIQGKSFKEQVAWRGNLVIAKYRDNPFSSMIDASMADFPILKNYLLTHGSPRSASPQPKLGEYALTSDLLSRPNVTSLSLKVKSKDRRTLDFLLSRCTLYVFKCPTSLLPREMVLWPACPRE